LTPPGAEALAPWLGAARATPLRARGEQREEQDAQPASPPTV